MGDIPKKQFEEKPTRPSVESFSKPTEICLNLERDGDMGVANCFARSLGPTRLSSEATKWKSVEGPGTQTKKRRPGNKRLRWLGKKIKD